jgi:hypothetical protein
VSCRLTDHGDCSSLAAELIEEIGDVSEDYVLVIHENIAQVLDGVFFHAGVDGAGDAWFDAVLGPAGLKPSSLHRRGVKRDLDFHPFIGF